MESIFENLKAVLDPIIQPVGETAEDHLKSLDDHEERVRELLEALQSANLNINFGDHSEYFHHLCSPHHLIREC